MPGRGLGLAPRKPNIDGGDFVDGETLPDGLDLPEGFEDRRQVMGRNTEDLNRSSSDSLPNNLSLTHRRQTSARPPRSRTATRRNFVRRGGRCGHFEMIMANHDPQNFAFSRFRGLLPGSRPQPRRCSRRAASGQHQTAHAGGENAEGIFARCATADYTDHPGAPGTCESDLHDERRWNEQKQLSKGGPDDVRVLFPGQKNRSCMRHKHLGSADCPPRPTRTPRIRLSDLRYYDIFAGARMDRTRGRRTSTPGYDAEATIGQTAASSLQRAGWRHG